MLCIEISHSRFSKITLFSTVYRVCDVLAEQRTLNRAFQPPETTHGVFYASLLSRDLGRFVDEMPNARLVWVEECGHVPHLEQPDLTATAIVEFVKNGNPAKVSMICSAGREDTGLCRKKRRS